MAKVKTFITLVPALLVLCGCASTITNLTPRQALRNKAGLYPVEARWDSNQRSIRKDSITPYVVVGLAKYPMQRTPLTVNRWETLVPAPIDQRFLNYRFKFDYQYDSIPMPRSNSRLSPPYQLEIMDK
jgi:hypothetical protein